MAIVNLMRKFCLKRVLQAGRFDRRDWQEADFLSLQKRISEKAMDNRDCAIGQTFVQNSLASGVHK
jgi:hypothetical protein